ncbi:MarR family winged helix-turn-helix transcriptional regulator [Nocardia nova]|uniref:MarR family winged helix-turn-helix transcriptional regulator n=1 Tax=Nocardia nova TaxID=37330 RepID=UPI00189348CD|nr:MarR family transcriptional regulator [Nocardia nova]MBF6150141.1 MarR family transcriptional regulator [Nocardia nova]MDN2495483.1 MarR family transcriptional regulator [Nocardia nova]
MDSEQVIDQIAQQLIRLGRIRERTNAQVAAASHGDIDLSAYRIIFRLLCDGPMRSGSLAEAMYSDASTISRQVAALVKRGLLRREADPSDGRASVLIVTDAGKEMAAHLRVRRNEMIGRILTDWNDPDRELFAVLLHRFVDDYEAARPAILTLPSPTEGPATEKNS